MPPPRFLLNHVGLCVPSIERYLKKHAVLYKDFEQGPLIDNPTQKVRELFLKDGKAAIELLEPTGPTSPLADFLKRNRSGGLVHLALEVDDLEKGLADIVAAGGMVMVHPTPDVAFAQKRIAFVLIDGLLTELIER